MKYYSLKAILAKKAQYNIIIGERSNGKTYAVELYGVERYTKTGEQMALVRRFKEDFRGKRGQHIFDSLVDNRIIEKLTKGNYNDVSYYNGQWFLSKFDENTQTIIKDNKPFCIGFSLSDVEHDKSTSYPNITTVLFDEFLTRQYYLNDEFILFMNTLSTIIRQRDNVTIFMLGNTVNKYCPYFREFGLTHITQMKQGSIDVYTYGDSELKVAVEYCDTSNKTRKKSDLYFAFNNPKLEMIKSGAWELEIYPHLPHKYKPENIMFTFFIVFHENILQCEVISTNNEVFLYIHQKTTDLQYKNTDLIYNLTSDSRPNIRKTFCRPIDKIDRKIVELFTSSKVFYQNNEIGEIVRNFIIQSGGKIWT